jgi:hypothetical protein
MDAVHVVAEDVALRDVVCEGNRRALAMALPAQPGNAHRGNRRIGIGPPQNIMCSVALLARRSRPVATLGRDAMQALVVLRLLIGVAAPAVHSGELLFVREFLNRRKICMAVTAFKCGVRRCA